MTKMFFTLFFVFTFSLFFSQSRKKIIKNKIYSIKTEKIVSNSKNEILNIKKFDKQGNLIFETDYDKNGKWKFHNEWLYNRNSDLLEYSSFKENGQLKTKEKYNYKSEKLYEILYFGENGDLQKRILNKYDVFGDKIEEISYSKDGNLIEKIVYEYDKFGLKSSRKIYNDKNEIIEERIYIYNKD